MWHLKSHETVPPGAFPFNAIENGIRLSVPAMPTIEASAEYLLQLRRANGLPRTDYQTALIDVDHQTCLRLRRDDRWCVNDELEIIGPRPHSGMGCAGCGKPVAQ
jgi:hypothetical protein